MNKERFLCFIPIVYYFLFSLSSYENILLPNIYLKLREMDFNNKILLESMKNDKKRIGNFLTVIIPDKDFRMIKVDDVTDMEFDNVMNTLKIICLK